MSAAGISRASQARAEQTNTTGSLTRDDEPAAELHYIAKARGFPASRRWNSQAGRSRINAKHARPDHTRIHTIIKHQVMFISCFSCSCTLSLVDRTTIILVVATSACKSPPFPQRSRELPALFFFFFTSAAAGYAVRSFTKSTLERPGILQECHWPPAVRT